MTREVISSVMEDSAVVLLNGHKVTVKPSSQYYAILIVLLSAMATKKLLFAGVCR